MKFKSIYLISILAGIACGIISNQRLFSGSVLNLIFWGVVGLILGFPQKEKREKVWSGLLYGFSVTISFLISGFNGAPNKLARFVMFSLFLSAIGAACGLVLVFLGARLKKLFRDKSK
jgi:apolipoprotein N-acyltransferase